MVIESSALLVLLSEFTYCVARITYLPTVPETDLMSHCPGNIQNCPGNYSRDKCIILQVAPCFARLLLAPRSPPLFQFSCPVHRFQTALNLPTVLHEQSSTCSYSRWRSRRSSHFHSC